MSTVAELPAQSPTPSPSPVLVVLLALSMSLSGCGPDEPSAPSELNAESQDGSITTNWVASDGEVAGYNVYQSTSSFQEVSQAQRVNESLIEETSYTDQEVENRTTYYYRVTAVAKSGGLLGIGGGSAESDPSDEVGKTPFSDPPSRP